VPHEGVVVALLVALPSQAAEPQHRLGEALTELRPGFEIGWNSELVRVDGALVELTRLEFGVLAHLAARPGRVLSRRQLLDAVWDVRDARYIGPRTVDVHVHRIRGRLGRHAEALRTVRGVGYRWVP
jgi:DNA-binding response OmpR family regulator